MLVKRLSALVLTRARSIAIAWPRPIRADLAGNPRAADRYSLMIFFSLAVMIFSSPSGIAHLGEHVGGRAGAGCSSPSLSPHHVHAAVPAADRLVATDLQIAERIDFFCWSPLRRWMKSS